MNSTNFEHRWRQAQRAAVALALALAGASAWAQGFAAYISPPRVTMQAQAGKPQRQVLEIQHSGEQAGRYRFYTVDWRFNADQALVFSNEVTPDSCRPWVAIERREIKLEPGERYRYRFEVQAPPDTPARECRFAIMVEGMDAATVQQSGLSLPVNGRIGVIVYAAIGGAKPQLELSGQRTDKQDGQPLAVIMVRNTGNAHGRLDGFVDATDAEGRRVELSPQDLPILPGETRAVSLRPVATEKKPAPSLRFPLRVKGDLEWGRERLPLDLSFVP